jgi:PKD domain
VAAVVAASVLFSPCIASASSSPLIVNRALVSKGVVSSLPTKQSAPEFKTFSGKSSSSSGRVYHASSVAKAPSKSVAVKPRVAASGTTIYVDNSTTDGACPSGPGTGTAADPYCLLQDAINAASSGDTVSVSGSLFGQAVTITTSGLTILSTNTSPPLMSSSAGDQPALVLNGADDITISNIAMEGGSVPAVVVEGSSNITLDSDQLISYNGLGPGTVTIDGSSSAVTVSRSLFSLRGWAGDSIGVDIAAGASKVTVASDIFSDYAGAGIEAVAPDGLDVVGDTIQRSCGPAVSISGAATGVFIENSVIDEQTKNMPPYLGGISDCTAANLPWAPDISVTADAVAGTTSDYNDFSSSIDQTDPYSWAGTTYSLLSAFHAATSQGAHDTEDTVVPGYMFSSVFDESYVDAIPLPGSASLNSANTSAPGALASDLYGNSPYNDRGAITIVSKVSAALTVTDDSALGVTAEANGSASGYTNEGILSYSFTWGDGRSTTTSLSGASHTYTAKGTYTVSLSVTDGYGFTASTSVQVTTAPDDHMSNCQILWM